MGLSAEADFGPRTAQVVALIERIGPVLSREQWLAMAAADYELLSEPRARAATQLVGQSLTQAAKKRLDRASELLGRQLQRPEPSWFAYRHEFSSTVMYADMTPWYTGDSGLPRWAMKAKLAPLAAAGVQVDDLLPPGEDTPPCDVSPAR